MTVYVTRSDNGTLHLANLDLACPESDLQDAVVQLGMTLGFLVHHDRPARTATGWATAIQGHKGFPDTVCAHDGYDGTTPRRVWIECKSTKGRLSKEQAFWIDVLRSTGEAVYVVKPKDWNDGTIRRALEGGDA